MPGDALYQVTNLSSVWVIADVFEQDIGMVKTGAKATVRINAYPDKVFTGSITYVYPTLKAETRTIPCVMPLLPGARGVRNLSGSVQSRASVCRTIASPNALASNVRRLSR